MGMAGLPVKKRRGDGKMAIRRRRSSDGVGAHGRSWEIFSNHTGSG
jgi:hypothetical protein